MAVRKCDPEEVGAAIVEMLQVYTAEVGEEIKKRALKICKEAKNRLRQTAPINKHSRGPHYAKSWKVKVVYQNRYESRVTVYNSKYQVSHLLENGHQLRQGGRLVGHVEARPHVAPVQQWTEETFLRECEEVLKSAGH